LQEGPEEGPRHQADQFQLVAPISALFLKKIKNIFYKDKNLSKLENKGLVAAQAFSQRSNFLFRTGTRAFLKNVEHYLLTF
jgi:hypothetical protein